MSEADQTEIPRSFVDLFVKPGAIKPNQPRAFIAQRYELCEDMAQMLTEHARTKLFELGVAEQDVLERVQLGLLEPGSVISAHEAEWVIRRLAELLEWQPLA